MSERKSSVILELKNRIGGPLRQIGRQVKRETAGIRRSFASVSHELRRVGAGFGLLAGAGVAGLTKFTKDVADGGDNVAKMADQLGIGVEALQEYRFAAERMGVSQETFNQSIGAFSNRIGKAHSGQGALATYLKKANPELLKQLTAADSLEDALKLYLDAIEATESPMDKAAGASAAFSRAGLAMIRVTRDGAQNIDDLRKRARELGLVMSEKTARDAETFQDSLTDMGSAMTGVRNIIGGALLPAISQIMDQITTNIVDNAAAIRAWASAFADKLPARIERFKEVVVAASKRIEAFVDMVGGWKVALSGVALVLAGPLITSTLGMFAAIVSLGSKLKLLTAAQWLFNAALTANPIGLTVTAIAGLIAILASLGIGFDDVTRVVNEAVDYWSEAFSGWLDSLKNVWSSAVSYVKSKVEAIKNLVPAWMRKVIGGGINVGGQAISGGVGAVGGALSGVKNFLGFGSDQGAPAAARSVARPQSSRRQDVGVGGLINIKIDSEGRPRVTNITKQGPVDLDVDSGPLFGSAFGGGGRFGGIYI